MEPFCKGLTQNNGAIAQRHYYVFDVKVVSKFLFLLVLTQYFPVISLVNIRYSDMKPACPLFDILFFYSHFKFSKTISYWKNTNYFLVIMSKITTFVGHTIKHH